MANGHALLGASGSKMWLNCPGSARLNEMIPETTSEDAEEGRVAHELSELMVRKTIGAITPQKFTGGFNKIKKTKYYNEEMLSHCEGYLEYVMSFPCEYLLIEQKLDYSEWVPEGYGTGDAVLVGDDILRVIDLKYGKGVAVEAEDNTQLKFYALGAIGALSMIYDFEKVVVHIYQPRLGAPSTAEYTVQEILEWAESIRSAAQKAWDGVQEYHSGEWCRWCKARATCQTRMAEEAQNAFMVQEPEEVALMIPNQITEAEISYWLGWAPRIEKFLKDLRGYALNEAELHGRKFAGFKLVEGRSNRKYADESAIISLLDKSGVESGYIETKLIGVTALQKHLGKKRFDELIGPMLIKAPGKPTLVPEDDPREEINSSAAAIAVFTEEEE